jgi:hypothetical protein
MAVFKRCSPGLGICAQLAQQLLHRFLPLFRRSSEIDFCPPAHVPA